MTDVVIIEAGGPLVMHPRFLCCLQQDGSSKSVYMSLVQGFSSLLIPAIRYVLFLAQCGGLCQYTHQTNLEILQLQIIVS